MHPPITGRPTNAAAEAVIGFWFHEAKPRQWFRRDSSFDQIIRERFDGLHKSACTGRLDAWRTHSRFCLSLIILLDQFSRNMFRGDAATFAQDDLALDVARDAIGRRFDKIHAPRERAFFYMPFMHSENLSVQDQSVALFKSQLPGTMNVPYAIQHRDIVKKFGRFPHRNKILGRDSTAEEIAYLKAGGFNP